MTSYGLNKKDLISLGVLILITLLIPIFVLLVKQTQQFNSQAASEPSQAQSIEFFGPNVSNSGQKVVTTSKEVKIRLNSPQSEVNKQGSGYQTESQKQIRVLNIVYFPTNPDNDSQLDTSVTGLTDDLSSIRFKVENHTTKLLDRLTEATRFRGYATSSSPALSFSIVDTKEFTTRIPSLNNHPDYAKILSDIDICNYIDGQDINQIWFWGYSRGNITLSGTNMAMGTNLKSFWNYNNHGEVSIGDRTNDMPICSKTYTLFNYNYENEDIDKYLELQGQQLDYVMAFVDDSLWTKYKRPYGSTSNTNHCGTITNPPNTSRDRDYTRTVGVDSDCEDWKPDGSGEVKKISCTNWYGSSCPDNDNKGIEYKVWWMQNIPGINNGLVHNDRYLRNWWTFIGDFDNSVNKDKSLVDTTQKADSTTTTTTPSHYKISNVLEELEKSSEKPFNSTKTEFDWILPEGLGEKTVYVQFKIKNIWKNPISTKITLSPSPVVVNVATPSAQIATGSATTSPLFSPYDFNKDGKINAFDITIFIKAWRNKARDAQKYDFNQDKKVNSADYSVLKKNFSK